MAQNESLLADLFLAGDFLCVFLWGLGCRSLFFRPSRLASLSVWFYLDRSQNDWGTL